MFEVEVAWAREEEDWMLPVRGARSSVLVGWRGSSRSERSAGVCHVSIQIKDRGSYCSGQETACMGLCRRAYDTRTIIRIDQILLNSSVRHISVYFLHSR